MTRPAWGLLAVITAICVTIAVMAHRTDKLSPRQHALMADLERLRGDDGLFTSTAELGDPGLYASAFGLSALAESGVAVQVGPSQITRATFGDQLSQDPLWGRYYLARLEQVLHLHLHAKSDVTALRRMRQADGSFLDPKVQAHLIHDRYYRLSTTSAALQALRVFGDPMTDRRRSANWLDTAGPTAADDLSGRLQLLRARAALNLPRSPDLPSVLAKWWATYQPKNTGDNHALVETCSFVLLTAESGSGLSDSQRGRLRKMLTPTTTVPGDPQLAELLTDALQHLNARPPESLIQIIQRHRLPDSGLVSEVQQRNGDLEASFLVQQLRAGAGLPTKDPRLARALLAHRADLVDKAGPGAGAIWLATLTSAGGTIATTDAKNLISQARSQLLRPVTPDRARQWSELAAAMATLNKPIPGANVRDLDRIAGDRQRYVLDLILPYLDKRAQEGAGPATRTAQDGIRLLAAGQVTQAAAAMNAATTRGWRPSDADRRQIAVLLQPHRGCPRTAQLYRETGIPQCNIYTSLAAWKLLRMAQN